MISAERADAGESERPAGAPPEGPAPPTLEWAAARLGVDPSDLNPSFGVVPVDPARALYCVEVREDRVPADLESRAGVRGPYANPKIEAFGPAGAGSRARSDDEGSPGGSGSG